MQQAIGTVALLLTLGLALPATPQGGASRLPEVWKGLEGKTGYLEATECRYVFTLSSPTQVANATVVRVVEDHVVFAERRDGESGELVIPLWLIVLRRPAG